MEHAVISTDRRSKTDFRRIAMPLLLACCGFAAEARAIEFGSVQVKRLQGPGWSAEEVELQLSLQDDLTIAATLRAKRLALPVIEADLRAVEVTCSALTVSRSALACADSSLAARGLPFDSRRLRIAWRYQPDSGDGSFTLQQAGAAGGVLSAEVQFDATSWQAQLNFRRLEMATLSALAAARLELPWPQGFDGRLGGQVALSGATQLHKARGRITLSEVNGANDAGTLAAENLAFTAQLDLDVSDAGWQGRLGVSESTGQAYLHPVFVDFVANPLQGVFNLTGSEGQKNHLHFDLTQQGIGAVNGAATFIADSIRPRNFDLQIEQAELPGAYKTYLQPFLVGTTADRLETIGSLQAQLVFADGQLQTATATLVGVHADDRRDRFALYDLNGELSWHREQEMSSSLAWAGGYLYRMGIGPADLELLSGAGQLRLQSAVSIPLLDGQLVVSRFGLKHRDGEVQALEFAATIEQIGMRALTRALGWPAFPGVLNGRIPRMQYADDAITVDGILEAQVFGGQIAIENLRIAEPFGVLPQIGADLRLRSLDLAAITSAFSFGRMEGLLDGDIERLRLLGLTPVAFDARLYTPPDDRSRHRISQRAIENISDLGGAGAAAVLSRGLLRFFEAFSYDEIGWSCRLRDEVCQMDGVAPAPANGYYIVKGKGVPRINVIGYSRRVSWPELVEKLRNINADQARVQR